MQFVRLFSRRIAIGFTLALLLVLGVRPLVFRTQAARLPNRQVMISSSLPSSTANYDFSFVVATDGQAVGSIRFLFCANSPIFQEPCVAPTGFDASAATLSDQQGNTGFSIAGPETNANTLVLTRPATAASAVTSSYEFANVVNPSSTGSYYVRVETFGSTDATGPDIDYGGIAYTINEAVNVSTYVPPYLLFCSGVVISAYDCSTASGDYLNLGELSTTITRAASSELVMATNAKYGLAVWLDGTTMTSGNNVITAMASTDVSRPGTAQFGLNLRQNSDPAIGDEPGGPGIATVEPNYDVPDRFRFVPGEQLIAASGANDYRKFTVSYIINIPHGQAPGVYVSSVTYLATADF